MSRTAATLTIPRLYPILDTAVLARRGADPLETAEIMLSSGVKILQLRHKAHFSREQFETAECIAALCSRAGAPFVVNDRADIAALLGAGLHVGQDDLPPAEARGIIGPGALLGFSTHSDAQLTAAAGESADYLALGPMFATASKENPDPVVGVDRWAEWRKLTLLPVVAIGGITRRNAAIALKAGASSLAVIGDLYPEPFTPEAFKERIREWLNLVS